MIFGAPFAAAAPVAKASSVSEVEVSLSMVTALKVSSTPLLSSDCSTADESGASVNTNDSIVAMSGAIMPAPLAMPLMVTLALPSFTVAVATFGKVSVVMIAFAALIQSSGAALSASVASTPSNLVASSGSPITPVEARNTSLTLQPTAFEAIEAVSVGRLPAGLAGEGVGIAGIHHQRARRPPLRPPWRAWRGTIPPARTGISTW